VAGGLGNFTFSAPEDFTCRSERPRLEALGLSAANLTEYDTLRAEAVAALAALASAGQRMAAVHRHMLAFTQRLQALMPNPND
jgi:hypothetical protein